jgi:hypothetical protein
MASRSNKEADVQRKPMTASPGVSGAFKDLIKSVGDSIGSKATKVPDKDGKPVKPRSLREKQMEELGL